MPRTALEQYLPLWQIVKGVTGRVLVCVPRDPYPCSEYQSDKAAFYASMKAIKVLDGEDGEHAAFLSAAFKRLQAIKAAQDDGLPGHESLARLDDLDHIVNPDMSRGWYSMLTVFGSPLEHLCESDGLVLDNRYEEAGPRVMPSCVFYQVLSSCLDVMKFLDSVKVDGQGLQIEEFDMNDIKLELLDKGARFGAVLINPDNTMVGEDSPREYITRFLEFVSTLLENSTPDMPKELPQVVGPDCMNLLKDIWGLREWNGDLSFLEEGLGGQLGVAELCEKYGDAARKASGWLGSEFPLIRNFSMGLLDDSLEHSLCVREELGWETSRALS